MNGYDRSAAAKRVAIVGAGCSGLTSVKSCLEEGIEPQCFEMSSDIGGLWRYTESTPSKEDRLHASVYESCTINTSKEMSTFSDFPAPRDFAPYMHHRQVLKYIRMYADHFKLLSWVRFDTKVERIAPSPCHAASGRWTVYSVNLVSGERQEETFDGVMVCSGHHRHPYVPPLQGIEKFAGTVLHSSEYKRAAIFKNKRVLVVGLGNSGADIAVDASYLADEVHASTNRGTWIFSRFFPGGFPADALANSRFMFALPRSLLQWAVEQFSKFRYNADNYGLAAAHRGLEAHPTIHDILLVRIMSGLVKVKPSVDRFTRDGVYYADGTFQPVDVVVLATGYDVAFPFLSEEVMYGSPKRASLDAYKFTFLPHLKKQTLAFIGLVQPVGSIMPISELQARWFTRVLTGKAQLPDESTMLRHVEERKDWVEKNMVKSRRHHLETFWIKAMDDIAEEIGAKPDLKQLLIEDPLFALRCFFGPCVPAQFRLRGPGKWEGARAVVEQAFQNMAAPTRTRVAQAQSRAKCRSAESPSTARLLVLKVLLLIAVLLFVGSMIVSSAQV